MNKVYLKLFIVLCCVVGNISSNPYLGNFSIDRQETIDIRKVHQGEKLSFKIFNVDFVEIYNKPKNATFEDFTFEWEPCSNQSGLFNIVFKLSNDNEGYDFIHFYVVVLDTIFNIPVNEKYSYLFTATDPDDDPVRIEAYDLPDGVSFTGDEFGPKLFEWTPSESQIGIHEFTIKATDEPQYGNPKHDIKNIKINVQNLSYEAMQFDFNNDGKIDLLDFLSFSRYWMKGVEGLDEEDEEDEIYEEDEVVDLNQIVYKTTTGTRYHLEDCSFLGFSKHEITLINAILEGLLPCSRCNPPDLDLSYQKQMNHNTDLEEIMMIMGDQYL